MSTADTATLDSRYFQSVPIVAKDHHLLLMSALHEQQQSGNLCDVSLVLENERFSAHKAVLASFSSYFQTLFENGQQSEEARSKACNVKEIVLSSVKKSTFLVILNFIYTSHLHIFKENFGDILRTSRKLHISSIVEICSKIIEDGVILPTLSDPEQSNIDAELEAKKQADNNTLYVDLNECDGDDCEMDTRPQSKNSEIPNATSTSRQGGKAHLGFEKLPDTHSNGWPMRSREAPSSSTVNMSSFGNGEPLSMQSFVKTTEPLQVKSIYSIATHMKGKKSTGLVTNACSSSSATHPCFSHDSTIQSINKKVLLKTECFTCTFCEKSFSKRANLQRHILIKHSTGHRFSCPKCGKTYAIEQSLRYHVSTSDCTRPSLSSVLDDISPNLTGSGTIPQLIHPSPSTFYHHFPVATPSIDLTALETSNSNAHNQRVHASNSELSPGHGFLQQSFVSTSVDDVISLNIPTTTLFPSIANLGDPTAFDRLDTSNVDGSFYKLSQDSSSYTHFSHSTPVSTTTPVHEQNTNSDDDMPTISRVQSIRQPFPEQCDHEEEIGPTTTPSNTPPSYACKTSNEEPSSQPHTTCPNTQHSSMITMVNSAPNSPLDTESSSGSMKTTNKQLLYEQHGTTPHPVLLQNPIDVSSFAGLLSLSNTIEGGRYQYIQPAPALSHNYNLYSQNTITDNFPSTSITNMNSDDHILHMCVTCNRTFESVADLHEHKRKCCKCPFCNRVFTVYSNMKRHVDVFHSKQKAHKCKICGRAYGIKQSMQIHMHKKHGVPIVTRKYNYKNRQPKSD